MPLQVAFLRAINVGKRRVSMDRLRQPLVDLGYDDVSTFIASGNVVFRARTGVEREIEAALTSALGFEVTAFVRPAAAIGKITVNQPFTGSDDLVQVGFVEKAPAASARRAVEALSDDSNELTTRGTEVYWLAREGVGRTTVSGAAVEKALGAPATFRSVKMLRRLASRLG